VRRPPVSTPLEHQALIQIYGSKQNETAGEGGCIAPRYRSGLRLEHIEIARGAETSGAPCERSGSTRHLRSRDAAGRKELLHRIDEQVHLHVDFFTQQLPQDAREAAISIMMFYIGISLTTRQVTKSNIGR
jgi:hypothetical protein